MEEKCVKEEVFLDDDQEASVDEEKLFLASHVKIESDNNKYEYKETSCIKSADKDPEYILPDNEFGDQVKQKMSPENQQHTHIKEETQKTDKSTLDQSECVESTRRAEYVHGIFGLDPEEDEERRCTTMYSSMEDESVSSCSFTSNENEVLHGSATPAECFSSSDIVESTSENRHLPHRRDSCNSKSPNSKDITKKRFQCDLCEQRFSSSSNLKDHLRFHAGVRPFECDRCERKFTRKLDLKRHQRTHTGEKPFECYECGRKFTQKHNLTMHKQVHTGVKPFECDHCEMKFLRIGDLNRHQRIPDREKPFECDQCQRKFCNKRALKVHEGAHGGEKTFNCDQCKRNFWKKIDLQRHQRIHTGEKPFQCDQCELSFAQKFNLVIHKRLHSGERPFECDLCDQTFSRKDTLKVHQRVHAGEQPYKCDKCQETFSYKRLLNVHRRTHSNDTLNE